MILTLLALLYVAIGVLTYGLMFAYWQREWPSLAKEDYQSDLVKSLVGFVLWPASLLFLALRGGFRHGLKFY